MVREPLSRLISSFMYAQHDLTFGNASLLQELSQLGPLPQRATFFALHAHARCRHACLLAPSASEAQSYGILPLLSQPLMLHSIAWLHSRRA